MYEITHLATPGGLPLDRSTDTRAAATTEPTERFDDFLIRAGAGQRNEHQNVTRSRQESPGSEPGTPKPTVATGTYGAVNELDGPDGNSAGNSVKSKKTKNAAETAETAESGSKHRELRKKKGEDPAEDGSETRLVDLPPQNQTEQKKLQPATGGAIAAGDTIAAGDDQAAGNPASDDADNRRAETSKSGAAAAAADGVRAAEVKGRSSREVAEKERGFADLQDKLALEQSEKTASSGAEGDQIKQGGHRDGSDVDAGGDVAKTTISSAAQEPVPNERAEVKNPHEGKGRDGTKNGGEGAERSERIAGALQQSGDKKVNRGDRSSNSTDKRNQRDESAVREIVVNLSETREKGEAGETERAGSDFRDVQVRMDATPAGGHDRAANGSVAEATQHLARRLNGSLGDTIVRQAQVIMKDADKGEIRLVIRPPELGRVRIQLQMDQGHIAGRILVDNQNVRQVIEQNLAALQRAFAEAGLEMGELEVGTGDARQQTDRGDRRDANTDSRDRTGEGADQFGRNVRNVGEYDYGNRRVNLVA